MAETRHHLEPGTPRHEARDVNIRLITLSGLGLLVLLGGSLMVTAWLFRALTPEPPGATVRPSLAIEPQLPPPQPRLQASPARDWRDMRAHEDGHLHAYGWVDPDAGVAHIPIAHAIELLMAKGLPTWHEEQASTASRRRGAPSP